MHQRQKIKYFKIFGKAFYMIWTSDEYYYVCCFIVKRDSHERSTKKVFFPGSCFCTSVTTMLSFVALFQITIADVKKVYQLFIDEQRSQKFLKEYEDEFMFDEGKYA